MIDIIVLPPVLNPSCAYSYGHQELVFTASQDSTIRVWGVQQTSPCAHVLRPHDGPVTGISLHATGDYLLSCATDAVSLSTKCWGCTFFRASKQKRKLCKVVHYKIEICVKYLKGVLWIKLGQWPELLQHCLRRGIKISRNVSNYLKAGIKPNDVSTLSLWIYLQWVGITYAVHVVNMDWFFK